MPLKVDVPIPVRVDCNEAGFNWLASASHQLQQLWGNTIALQGHRTTFFSGNLCAPLGALLLDAHRYENTVDFGNVSGAVLKVWSMNDFCEHFGGARMSDHYDTTLAYQNFSLGKEQKDFAAYVTQELMSKELPENMSPAVRSGFAKAIMEIFDNAVSHSQSEQGVFCCGQYFPQQSRLTFTLTDLGIGFRRNIEERGITQIKQDYEAIKWATQRGNTTRHGGKGGSGLALLREFFGRNGGKLQIVSQSGFWQIHGHKEYSNRLHNVFPGSFINLEINTDDETKYEVISKVSGNDIF